MSLHYILVDREPVACDLLTWGRYFETGDRRVAFDELATGLKVSTVFLGLDHRYSGDGPPVLFETMAFATDEFVAASGRFTATELVDLIGMRRCCTWAEAEEQHKTAVAEVIASLAEG